MDEIQVLNFIYETCMNTKLTEEEVTSVITGIVEDRLSEFGMFPDGYDPNDRDVA